MYHDVISGDPPQNSGFPSPDAGLYKLTVNQFDDHLITLAQNDLSPITVFDLPHGSELPWMVTFDDGGISAWTIVAERLEARGWRGHFFVTTDFIDTPSFLTQAQIRDLHNRGHVIGSHSCSHPLQMARLPSVDILREWKDSVQVLSSILGHTIDVASVPGGQYSREVGEAAAAAGIRILFTSEPTVRHERIGNCLVLGRYAIQRWTLPKTAADIALGHLGPRLQQSLIWNAKKIVKALGGAQYLRVRRAISSWVGR